MKLLTAALAMGIASSALSAYTVQSRFSEVKRVSWNWLEGNSSSSLGSTTSFNPFIVYTNPGNPNPANVYQESSLSAFGATYRGYTSAWGTSGPPAGSNRYGQYETSSFELNFNLSTTESYALAGSFIRGLNGNTTLKLERISGTPTVLRSFVADWNSPNWQPIDVNWTGVLTAGNYRLSIFETGAQAPNGEVGQMTQSNFTFQVPAPGAPGAFLALALIATRRRRNGAC
ncbi:MAG: hypothetical protein KF691_10390 [Phycisphaeraceae bacterium]|nr:hypothetical protein [Phycisphaeraceae bacterium]